MAWNRNPYSFGDRALEKDRFDRKLAENQRQFDNTFGEGQYQYRRSQGELEDQFDNTFGEGQYRYRRSQGELEDQFDKTHDLERDKFGEGQYQYDRSQGELESQFDVRTEYDYNVLDQDWDMFRDKLNENKWQFDRGLQHDWAKFVPDARLRQLQSMRVGEDRETMRNITAAHYKELQKEVQGDERVKELSTGLSGFLKTFKGQLTGELPIFQGGDVREAARYESKGIPVEFPVSNPAIYNLLGLTQ